MGVSFIDSREDPDTGWEGRPLDPGTTPIVLESECCIFRSLSKMGLELELGGAGSRVRGPLVSKKTEVGVPGDNE